MMNLNNLKLIKFHLISKITPLFFIFINNVIADGWNYPTEKYDDQITKHYIHLEQLLRNEQYCKNTFKNTEKFDEYQESFSEMIADKLGKDGLTNIKIGISYYKRKSQFNDSLINMRKKIDNDREFYCSEEKINHAYKNINKSFMQALHEHPTR